MTKLTVIYICILQLTSSLIGTVSLATVKHVFHPTIVQPVQPSLHCSLGRIRLPALRRCTLLFQMAKIPNGDSNDVDANADANAVRDKANVYDNNRILNGNEIGGQKTARRSPRFPPEAFDINNVLADDTNSPLFYPELKVMDYLKSSRLLNERSYARKEQFTKNGLKLKPTVQDLSSPPTPNIDKLWVSSWFRLFTFSFGWMVFPYITQFLYSNALLNGPDSLLDDNAFNLSTFLPSVSLIYGTFITLTLQILYDRQKFILGRIGKETSLLVVVTQNVINLLKNDSKRFVEAGQCIADHVGMLVMESRGKELMTIMYSDPFVRLLDILSDKETELLQETGRSESLIGYTRDVLKDLYSIRAERLSGESSCLPPTHFALMSILTAVLLVSFSLSTVPTLSSDGIAPNETRFMFATFLTVYVVFYIFALDLNNPFTGVYQIRRSGPAAQLLQTKMLLMNNPILRDTILFDGDYDHDE